MILQLICIKNCKKMHNSNVSRHLLLLVQTCVIIITGLQMVKSDSNLDTLKQFFSRQRISFRESMQSEYSEEVIKAMANYNKLLDNEDVTSDDLDNSELVVVEEVYNLALSKTNDDTVIIKWFDLIVPADESQENVVLLNAKKDIGKFYEQNKELASNMLKTTKFYILHRSLYISDAVSLLNRFYNYWIPLGRLTTFESHVN